MALLSNNNNQMAAQPATQRREQVGTGFTNLNRLINANKNNRLGSTIGQGITGQAATARQGVQTASQKFNEQAQANRLDTDQNKQRAQSILGNVENVNDDDVNAFTTFRSGRYEGPNQIEGQQKLLNQASSAESLGNLATSQGGRQALLQRFVGGAGYNQGKQRLDNLLLGSSAGNTLRNARRETAGLTENVSQAADAAQQTGNFLANQARQFGQQVTGQATTMKSQGSNALDAYVNSVAHSEEDRQKLFKSLRDQLTGVDWSNEEAALNKVNSALDLGKDYVGNADENALIQELYKKSKTPIQQLIKQTRVGDRSGLFGYGEQSGPITTYSEGGPIMTDLKINDLLRDSFETRTAENVNRAGLVTDVDKSKLNNLARLLGQQQEFTDPNAARYKAGTGAFDFNKAGQELDKDIARLKGDNITDLGTIYEETPMEKKLARTLMPDGSEAGKDLSKDFGSLFGDNQSVAKRIGAWTGIVSNPYRAGFGISANTLKEGATQVNDGVNQLFSGNIEDGAKTLLNAPRDTTKYAATQINDYLAEVPGVGNLTKPVGDAAAL
jgi:X-X-X-Leu-X-X-Gly heptad repeat protein